MNEITEERGDIMKMCKICGNEEKTYRRGFFMGIIVMTVFTTVTMIICCKKKNNKKHRCYKDDVWDCREIYDDCGDSFEKEYEKDEARDGKSEATDRTEV